MQQFENQSAGIIVQNLVKVIQENKEYLSEIDGAIGDGDHGINMNKGFTICGERLTGNESLSEAFQLLGDILLTEIGGSMGPIYGSFFIEMGDAIEEEETIDAAVFGKMLEAGLMGIRELVPTDIGDKTLLDALIPAVEAYKKALGEGKSFEEALANTSQAANAGKDATKDMIAKVGRASRLGERSRGVLDAGAASCALILSSMCSTASQLLA